MTIKQKYGVFNLFKNILKLFIEKTQPRYQLSLDSKKYDNETKTFKYLFKVYGDHSYITLSYSEIKNNEQILFIINPHDLIYISVNEHINTQKNSMLMISEILRENKFLISNGQSQAIFSGDEICDNTVLIEGLNNIDLYKVAYSTGLKLGRSLSKKAKTFNHCTKDNVFKLAVLENKM